MKNTVREFCGSCRAMRREKPTHESKKKSLHHGKIDSELLLLMYTKHGKHICVCVLKLKKKLFSFNREDNKCVNARIIERMKKGNLF